MTCVEILTHIHLLQWLISRARTLADVMTSNIINVSRKFNRGICTQYDNIVRKITAQSETTEDLVKQSDYVERLHVGELLELRVSEMFRSKNSVGMA